MQQGGTLLSRRPTSLHEVGMRNIELPGFMLAAEVSALLQDGLHFAILFHIPVNLGLAHQHCIPRALCKAMQVCCVCKRQVNACMVPH